MFQSIRLPRRTVSGARHRHRSAEGGSDFVQAYPGRFRLSAAAALAAAALLGVSGLAALAGPVAAAEVHQVNPYVGATQYVNPLWKAEVESEAVAQPSLATKMRVVENQPTAVWLDSMGAIAGPSGGMGLAAHLNAALTQKGSGPGAR